VHRVLQWVAVGEAGHADHVQPRVAEVEAGTGADHRGHVVPGVERLPHDQPADAATGAEHGQFHGFPLFVAYLETYSIRYGKDIIWIPYHQGDGGA
jgi:hypothetical protein